MSCVDFWVFSPHCFLKESVGPDNVEGFGKVNELAAYLLSLRNENGALSNEQAQKVITLWKNLSPYDQQPITFSPRHKPKLTQGRFKVSKTSVVPGVDSTRRYVLDTAVLFYLCNVDIDSN